MNARVTDRADRAVWREVVAVALLAAVVLAFFWPMTTLRAYLVGGDAKMQNYPFRTYVTSRIAKGELPLWCPSIACGFPLWAESQAGPLYPGNFVFFVLSSTAAHNYLVLLHLVLAAVGMYVFCRGCALGRKGAWFGGLVFSLGGYFTPQTMHVNLVCAAAWLPLILWLVHTSRRRPPALSIGLLALLMGVQLLASHGYATVLTFLAAGLHATALTIRYWRDDAAPSLSVRPLAVTVAAIALAVLTAGAQIVPSREFMAHTWRADGLSYQESVVTSLPPTHLATLVAPKLFGSLRRYWGMWESGYRELWMYSGVLPLGLAAMALAGGRRRRWLRWYLVGLGGLALLLAMGQFTPAWGLFRMLPVADMLRTPARFILLFVFALSVLAALGVEDLLRATRLRGQERVWKLLTSGAAASYALVAALHLVARTEREWVLAWGDRLLTDFVVGKGGRIYDFDHYARKARLAYDRMLGSTCPWDVDMLWALSLVVLSLLVLRWWLDRRLPARSLFAVSCVLVLGDLWVSSYGLVCLGAARNLVPPASIVSHLEAGGAGTQLERVDSVDTHTLAYNQAMLTRLQHVSGQWHSNPLLRHRELMAVLGDRELVPARPARTPTAEHLNVDLARALGVRWFVGPAPSELRNAGAVCQVVDGELLTRMTRVAPRAFVPRRISAVGSDQEALDFLMKPDLDLERESVALSAGGHDDLLPGGTVGEVRVLDYRPEQVALEAELSARGVVCLMDMNHPGWKAFVGGHRTPVLQMNYAFRGAVLEAGKHVVRFVFYPQSIRLGLFASLIGLTLVAALLSGAVASGPRRRHNG